MRSLEARDLARSERIGTPVQAAVRAAARLYSVRTTEAGTRLPSTRVLASSLGVSRTTTALAYELLLLEGSIESGVGDGTRVAHLQPEQLFQESRAVQDLDATDT